MLRTSAALEVEALIRRMNPTARVLRCQHGDVPLETLLNTHRVLFFGEALTRTEKVDIAAVFFAQVAFKQHG